MSPAQLPPHKPANFNAQHAAPGGFFSFTCGHFGSAGGFGLEIGRPGNQDVYIGVKAGDRQSPAPLRCLPFYEMPTGPAASAAFLVEQVGPTDQHSKPSLPAYGDADITRRYGWASDTWETPDFLFTIYTPIIDLPDPTVARPSDIADAVLPAVIAELVVDNSTGTTPKTACFALGVKDAATQFHTAGHGFSHRSGFGVRAEAYDGSGSAAEAFTFKRWSPDAGLRDINPMHLIGTLPGIGMVVPVGEVRVLKLVLGVHVPSLVTTGIEGDYFYTRYFASLDQVLDHALTRFDAMKEAAQQDDAKLLASGLNADQQFAIAHATRSYYGSTQLLDVGGEPFWVVNEGEYVMINTLDLSVDQVFWELDRNPWVVRNLLNNFVRYYSYHDRVRPRGSAELRAGGLSFCHDMGISNQFSPSGYSSYELPNLNAACFSYMTAEQLCNWVIIAVSYTLRTKDRAWAEQAGPILDACLNSLIHRGDENGFPAFDSSRCGPNGAEITTYDSLDHSLAQTRNNLYMVVKFWSAYVGLQKLYGWMGQSTLAECAAGMADRIAAALPGFAGPDGIFPAVFEPDNSGYASRILPAIEGLVYPQEWARSGTANPLSPAADRMYEALKTHTLRLLTDAAGRNLFTDGGLRLSSTSNNSWVSKIALMQYAARAVLHLDDDPTIAELLRKSDAAHAAWQTSPASAFWAMSDQMVNGAASGSRYYPRCITAALWLREKAGASAQ